MSAVELADITAETDGLVASGEQDQPRPWSLSPSRAGDFMTCPLLYRLRVIDRLPEPSSPVTTRGTLVHSVLERLFDSPAPERTLDRAASLLEPQWHRLLEERPELIDLFASNDAPADADADARPESAANTASSTDDAVRAWLASARVLLETYFRLEDPTRVEPDQRELLVEVELSDGVRLRGFVDRVDVAPSWGDPHRRLQDRQLAVRTV